MTSPAHAHTLFDFSPLSKREIMLMEPVTGIGMPAVLVCGPEEGGFFTVSAGVHSREYIGIMAALELSRTIDPAQVKGTVLFLPCINYEGFFKRSADVFPHDGKNLNRVFPGDEAGTETQVIAAYLEREVISHSDYLLDLHSGGSSEALTPHVYFHGTAEPDVCERSEFLARCMDVPYIVRSSAENGFYSHAGQCGVPAIILERGQLGLHVRSEVEQDISDIKNVLRATGFLDDGVPARAFEPALIGGGLYTDSPVTGFWYPRVQPGQLITKGQLLGRVENVWGEILHESIAEEDGIVLYMAHTPAIEAGAPMVAYGILS